MSLTEQYREHFGPVDLLCLFETGFERIEDHEAFIATVCVQAAGTGQIGYDLAGYVYLLQDVLQQIFVFSVNMKNDDV